MSKKDYLWEKLDREIGKEIEQSDVNQSSKFLMTHLTHSNYPLDPFFNLNMF